MDPNETLREIRELCRQANNQQCGSCEAYRLAELVEALDSWLTNQGFPPDEWSPKNN